MTKASTKKTELTKSQLIEYYMTQVLETEHHPTSVYRFCKDYKIKESEFYGLYNSLELLKSSIWEEVFEHTLSLLEKDDSYHNATTIDKALSFYYGFFELMKANRSYFLLTKPQSMSSVSSSIHDLKGLRTAVISYAEELFSSTEDSKLKIKKERVFAEAFWTQFLVILGFWFNDRSVNFSKTDALIEKSSLVFNDLVQQNNLHNLMDLGKFLIKEIA